MVGGGDRRMLWRQLEDVTDRRKVGGRIAVIYGETVMRQRG